MNFVCIGAQRAGTTYLYKMLSMHPNVYFPLGKEPNLFLLDPRQDAESDCLYRYGLRRMGGGGVATMGQQITGDISPYYAAMSRLKIKRIFDRYPQTRVLYVVRNPLERALSAIRFTRKAAAGNEAGNFGPALSSILKSPKIVLHSNYAANIERWRAAAAMCDSLVNLKVVLFSDIEERPLEFLKEVCSFIGVDGDFFGRLPLDLISSPHLATGDSRLTEIIDEECGKIYLGLCEQFEQLTGMDTSIWQAQIERTMTPSMQSA
jgi:hypothetical protein